MVIARDEWGRKSEWSDVKMFPIVENSPPNIPSITGPTSGKVGTPLEFTVVTTDPDNQDVYYDIFWGNAGSGDVGPFPSGEEQIFEHTWTKIGTWTIKVKAGDTRDEWSEYAEFKVRIGRSRSAEYNPFQQIFQQFPNIYQIFRLLFQL
jgi:hypothetical protein